MNHNGRGSYKNASFDGTHYNGHYELNRIDDPWLKSRGTYTGLVVNNQRIDKKGVFQVESASSGDFILYEGNWREDRPEGCGCFSFSTGSAYSGSVYKGQPAEFGVFICPELGLTLWRHHWEKVITENIVFNSLDWMKACMSDKTLVCAKVRGKTTYFGQACGLGDVCVGKGGLRDETLVSSSFGTFLKSQLTGFGK